MTMRPLTKEEKRKAKELIRRLNRDSKELYALVAPIVSHRDFCQMMASLRGDISQVIKDLENIRKIREFLGQLPEQQDLGDLEDLMEKLRV